MKRGDILATQEGRAEILLQPGAFLRISENSSFELVGNTFEDTRLRLITGAALIEVVSLEKDDSLRIVVQGREITVRKRGLYEFRSSGPGEVRVYDGELAVIALDGLPMKVKEGQEMAFNTFSPVKFDKDNTTALYRWGARRARLLAAASQSTGPGFSRGFNTLGGYSNWQWSPLCNCHYFYLSQDAYTPYRNVIYVPATITVTSGSSGWDLGNTTSPTSSAAGSSVTSGDSTGASAAPAAGAAATTTTNTADRRR
jgi:hypothetical protein